MEEKKALGLYFLNSGKEKPIILQKAYSKNSSSEERKKFKEYKL